MLKSARERREQRAREVSELGYVFDRNVNLNDLSLDELNDVAALNVNETTYIIIGENGADVRRVK